MVRPVFRVTYDIVTPESAEDGDVAERGFVLPGNWHISVDDPGDVGMTLREAVRLCEPSQDCGRWFEAPEWSTDYQTGGVESRSLHPPRNITPASYSRLAKLLGC